MGTDYGADKLSSPISKFLDPPLGEGTEGEEWLYRRWYISERMWDVNVCLQQKKT